MSKVVICGEITYEEVTGVCGDNRCVCVYLYVGWEGGLRCWGELTVVWRDKELAGVGEEGGSIRHL